jgi:succinoglycan biosynthesis protein ExoL
MSLVYLVHDLTDAAVARRLRMLRLAGESPLVMGFRRSAEPVTAVEDWPAADLGRTEDARLLRRIGSVLGQAIRLGRRREAFAGATVILARNLEMLALAWVVQRRFAREAIVVFECLDIHTSLTAPGRKGRLMRAIERRLLRGCAGLIVSSPAFVSEHFARLGIPLPPVRLVENKVLTSELVGLDPAAVEGPPPGPPWRIGWFGVIRCKRSLSLLADLARRFEGRVEIDIRGRPARNVLPEFDAVVAATPGLAFHGPYHRASDLAMIYGCVHFSWTLDFYEAGANSDWLLPNRLYEGGTQSAVAIGLDRVETGRWLLAHGAGVILSEPLEQTLPAWIATMTAAGFARAHASAAALPIEAIVCGPTEAAALVAWLHAPEST